MPTDKEESLREDLALREAKYLHSQIRKNRLKRLLTQVNDFIANLGDEELRKPGLVLRLRQIRHVLPLLLKGNEAFDSRLLFRVALILLKNETACAIADEKRDEKKLKTAKTSLSEYQRSQSAIAAHQQH